MNPPWTTTWNEINACIGNDPAVKVGRLNQTPPYVVRVEVRGPAKATAVASLMRLRHQFGNVIMEIEIWDENGNHMKPFVPRSVEELAELVRSAFEGNGYYRDVVVKQVLGARVYPVFAKQVIQFYNDDLSDLYSNYNNVASTVFANVLEPSVGGLALSCSTAKT